MFSWGRSGDGQLGLGGIEENVVLLPRWCKFMRDKRVFKLACGLKHTVILLDDGTMYSCGNNEKGQLAQDSSSTSPGLIEALDSYRIVNIACGHTHSCAIDDNGCLFAWGDNVFRQLGIGEEWIDPKFFPSRVRGLYQHTVVQVSCGANHTLALTQGGCVFSWGENIHGQLGHSSHRTQVGVPMEIEELRGLPIISMASGGAHNFVLSRSYYVFGWGRNNFGQLGVAGAREAVSVATEIDSLRDEWVRHIACGDSHSAVLTQGGQVLTFGCSNSGQLGHGSLDPVKKPTRVSALLGMEICQIACGRTHTLAVARDTGQVYSFGLGDGGQLGIPLKTHVSTTPILLQHNWNISPPPRQLFSPPGQSPQQISDSPRKLSAPTDNEFGTSVDPPLPDLEAMDTDECVTMVTMVHSDQLATSLDIDSDTMQVCSGLTGEDGLGSVSVSRSSEQMDFSRPLEQSGSTSAASRLVAMETVSEKPDLMHTSAEPGAMETVDLSSDKSANRFDQTANWADRSEEMTVLKRIYSGGDQSFASVTLVQRSNTTPTSLVRYLIDLRKNLTAERPGYINSCLDHPDGPAYPEGIHNPSLFSSASTVNANIIEGGPGARVSKECHCVSLDRFQKVLKSLKEKKATNDKQKKVVEIIRDELIPMLSSRIIGVECLRVFYILPLYLRDCVEDDQKVTFMKTFVQISSSLKNILASWFFATDSINYTKSVVKMACNVVSKQLVACGSRIKKPLPGVQVVEYVKFTDKESDVLLPALQFLHTFYTWNTRHDDPILHSDFYVVEIVELVDLINDYFQWKENVLNSQHVAVDPNIFTSKVVFCNFPAVLDASAKSKLMMIESQIQMKVAVHKAQVSNVHSILFGEWISDPCPSMYQLNIDRTKLMQDTLRQLVPSDDLNFKKPLRVSFVGEEGEDAGGVKKEFFMLLLHEILNPDFGMFIEDDESHMIWFRNFNSVFVDDLDLDHFVLIGILCGLAIYNAVIIDIPFPIALYKKLLGRPLGVDDLSQLYPSIGCSLKELLSYSGADFEDTFDLNFAITRSVFGELMTLDLVKDGSNKSVTVENRAEYCSAYVDYVLNSSVVKQFESFKLGFMKVCDGQIMKLMHPRELMTLMIGTHVVKWEEFRQYMIYKSGYSAHHLVIKLFWEVFFEFSTDIKLKFLVFYTGSNRIPIAGIKSMNMIIQGMDGGPGCEKLPVAHTCFNILDLPPYTTKLKMKQKLLQAINFTSGFGIV